MKNRLFIRIQNMGGDKEDRYRKKVNFKEDFDFEISEWKGYISS